MLSSYHLNSWWYLSEIMWVIRVCLVEPDFAIRMLAEVLHLYFDVQALLFIVIHSVIHGDFVTISTAAGNRCHANSTLFFWK